MSKCELLAKEIESYGNLFYNSTSTTDGKRTVEYKKVWFPGLGGVMNACFAREANALEKNLFKKDK
jgi:hypothetical protein